MPHTMWGRNPARTVTHKSTNIGKRHRWRMLSATLVNIPMPSFLTSQPIRLQNSRKTKWHLFMEAFGSSGILQRLATTTFRNQRSGTSPTTSGVLTSLPKGLIGGSRFIRRIICNVRQVQLATVAIQWITTSTQKRVAEWNVGCEKCHGPGSEHVVHPTRRNILNPAHMDYVQASDTCIQCHSQGRPLTSPIEGKYYDWPVGYRVGSKLQDYWQLEESNLGQLTFTHFPDGTAHKNRMQGNDFVQSVMYRRGVTCFSCHDVHGTDNYAQLRKPADQLCLDCHGPMSLNGPRTATIEEHTHHKAGSAGSSCIACHMPKIETTVADVKVRAHTFAFITPAMTDKYKIPNPCTTCHSDKTTAWATEQLNHWPERSPWRME